MTKTNTFDCTNCDAQIESADDIHGTRHIGCTEGEGYWTGEPDYEIEDDFEASVTDDE